MDKTAAILDSFQTDLRTLSTEARKKNPNIKEVAELSLMRLRTLDQQKLDQEKCMEAIAKTDEILKPFLLSFETKNPKMIQVAVTAIHKLIVYKAVSTTFVSSILSKLSEQAFVEEEPIQLKVVQTLVALATTLEIHDKQLSEIFGICFKLQASKYPTSVQNTASATIRQLLTMLYDRSVNELKSVDRSSLQKAEITETKSEPTTPRRKSTDLVITSSGEFMSPGKGVRGSSDVGLSSLPPFTQDAYLLLQDICTLTGGDAGSWLNIESIPKNFGLELIESILNTHAPVFVEVPEFSILLKDRICPVVIKTFRLSTEFPSVLRLIRIIAVFLKSFSGLLVIECEVFISRLIKMLDTHSALWSQTIALEVFKSICENPNTIRSIYKDYDLEHEHKSAKIFHNIVSSLGTFVQSMFNWDSILITKNTSQTKSRYLDQLSALEPPVVNETYAVSVAVDCLVGVVNALSKLAENESERYIGEEMANFVWPTLLGSLSTLLDKTNSDILLQDVLKAIVVFTNVCCTLKLSTPRDAFLTSLCKFTLPRSSPSSEVSIEVVLLPKNVQCLKALFAIGLHMGDLLDVGWNLLMDTFQQLDRILFTPHKLQQQPLQMDSITSPSGEMSSVLSASLDALFQSTQGIGDTSLRHLLIALRRISNDAIKNSKVRPLFGASKMLETVMHNVHRINKFWDIVFDHFTELSSHKDLAIRNFGVESVTQIISAALSVKTDTSSDSPLAMQVSFLSALDKLAQSPQPETVEKSLHTLNHILQAAGQKITAGWPNILDMLNIIPHGCEKQHIQIAFKSVQLICTDFLPHLTRECVSLYILTLGAYSYQKTELNVSLTAINLLLNISDFIAMESQKPLTSEPLTLESNETVTQLVNEIIESAMNTAVQKQLTGEKTLTSLPTYHELWMTLLMQVKTPCVDHRYEVRNCAVQILFKVLSSHGGILSQATWLKCLKDIIFPLVSEVRVMAGSASHNEVAESKGNVKLLVHFTRNTENKQWSETLVLALSGIVRVFKVFFTTLCQLEDFEALWNVLYAEIYEGSLFSSNEVATSAMQSGLELLVAHAQNSLFTKTLWDTAWVIFEKVSLTITEKERPRSTLNALIKSLSNAYTTLRSRFDNEDLKRILRIIRPLALHPPELDTELSDIQEEVLRLVKQIPNTDEVFPYSMAELLLYLSYCIGFNYNNSIAPDISVNPRFKPASMDKAYLFFAQQIVTDIVEITKATSSHLRVLVLGDIIKVIGASMMTKYVAYNSPLWRISVEALITLVQLCIPDINDSDLDDIKMNILWTEIADSIHLFLFAEEREKLPYISPEITQRDESIDISLVDLLARDMIGHAARVPKLHDQLIDIIMEGTTLQSNNREQFAVGCYRNLFYLCAKGESESKYSCNLKIARVVVPMLLKKCKDVLQKFIADEKKTGTLPAARARLAEISFILHELRVLEIHPDVDVDVSTAKALPNAILAGKKRHLLKMFPLLCDCITTKEGSLKDLLKDLFHEAAKEIGLE